MDLLSFINFYLVPGIVLGAIYALGAIGITLVFSVLRFAHLAHGDLATLGAFLVLALVAGAGIDPWLALPVAMAATAGISVAVHRSEEHTSELQSLMRITYDDFCSKKKKKV